MKHEELTRKQKVNEFFKLTGFTPYWCRPSVYGCSCRGCVNINSYVEARREWYKMYAGDPFLTENDVNKYNETSTNI